MRNHEEGFEKESKLSALHSTVKETHNCLYKWRDFFAVANRINPELCASAFERRPCQRRLQYIGYDDWPEPTRSEMNDEGHGYFVPGEIYQSYDFNGSTYSIRGYTDVGGEVIGCAYFKWVDDQLQNNAH